MAELQTRETDDSVTQFIASIADDQKRADAEAILALMRKITRKPPKMWGSSIIGFDSYHYVYESGREGDWFVCGFSPRKRELSLYIMAGFSGYEDLLAELGRHKTGKSCLYIKRLSDVDVKVLEKLIRASVKAIRAKYDSTDKAENKKSASKKSASKKTANKKTANKKTANKKPAQRKKTAAKKKISRRTANKKTAMKAAKKK